jgi:plastocyanin
VIALALVAGCAADPDDSVPVADEPAADGSEEVSEDTIPVPDELEDFTGQAQVTVSVRDNAFEPRNIRVDAGTEIVFELVGRNAHNVLPGIEGAFPDITDPDLVAGDASLVVEAAGEVPYYCSLHGTATIGMTGYIVAE